MGLATTKSSSRARSDSAKAAREGPPSRFPETGSACGIKAHTTDG